MARARDLMAEALRQALRSRGISPTRAAKKAGLHDDALNAVLRGARSLPAEEIDQILDANGILFEELLSHMASACRQLQKPLDPAAILASVDEIYPYQQLSLVMFASEWATRQPELANGFMLAYVRGVRDYVDAVTRGRDRDLIARTLAEARLLRDAAQFDQLRPVGLDLRLLQHAVHRSRDPRRVAFHAHRVDARIGAAAAGPVVEHLEQVVLFVVDGLGVRFEIGDLRVGDLFEPQLLFRFRKRDPKPSPRAELEVGGKEVGHLPRRVPLRQRVGGGIMLHERILNWALIFASELKLFGLFFNTALLD